MTICIGALAAGGRSIVCVADKLVSYSQYIQGDTDSTKIVPVGAHGAHVLISGGEVAVTRVLGRLAANSDVGQDATKTAGYLEAAWLEAEREVLEASFLHPLMTFKDYGVAITKKRVNSVIEGISKRVEEARANEDPFSCSLLLCGFDANGKPTIVSLQSPGLATNMTHTGFYSTGSGSGFALDKLLSCSWERTHPIDRVLYECFASKASAENDPSVGYDWDAVVLTKDRVETVPKNIKQMVERAWSAHERTPYEQHDPDEDLPLPPDNWKELLKEYAEAILPSAGTI